MKLAKLIVGLSVSFLLAAMIGYGQKDSSSHNVKSAMQSFCKTIKGA